MERKIIDLIKAKRLKNGYSQLELSKMAGMTISNYGNKEQMKEGFTFKMKEVLKLFSILDILLSINDEAVIENDDLISIIAKEREKNNLTQDAMRQKIGLKTHAAYFKKEKGHTSFTLTEFLNICNILHFEVCVKYDNMNDNIYTIDTL